MEKLNALLCAAALEACGSVKVSLGDTASEECIREPQFDACATDACPPLASMDPLMNLRTAVYGDVQNVGPEACDPTRAHFTLNGTSLGEMDVPALGSGESAFLSNDQSSFGPADIDALQNLTLVVDGASESATIIPANAGDSVYKGNLLERVEQDMGIPTEPCTEKPFDDVETYNPYCPAITMAQGLGWVTGEAGSDGLVYNPWNEANHAATAAVLFRAKHVPSTDEEPCADLVGSTEWYAPYIKAVEVQTGMFADEDRNCNPAKGTTLDELQTGLDVI